MGPVDDWNTLQPTRKDPARFGFVITPSTDGLAHVTRAIYVGSAGTLKVMLAGDSSYITLQAVPAGTLLPLAVRSIHPDSTASALIGLY